MRYCIIIILLSISSYSIGQQDIQIVSEQSRIIVDNEIPLKSQFLDSLFYNGTVIFKDGTSGKAMMNYHITSNNICFVQDTSVLLLTDLDKILLVNYGKRTFQPYKTEILEQISNYPNEIYLLKKRKSRLIENNQFVGPYGIKMDQSTGPKLSNVYFRKITATYVEPYLHVQGDKVNITVKQEISYYLRINGSIHKIARVKDLMKLFPTKSNQIVAYINDQKLSFKNEKDIKTIISFCTGK